MGRKVNPVGFRLGIVSDWDSKWFAERNYTEQLHEDLAIRLAAVTALGQLGSEQAREALEARLEDKEAENLYEAIEEALDEIDTFANLELLRYSGDEEE